jgi:hypothetical protein
MPRTAVALAIAAMLIPAAGCAGTSGDSSGHATESHSATTPTPTTSVDEANAIVQSVQQYQLYKAKVTRAADREHSRCISQGFGYHYCRVNQTIDPSLPDLRIATGFRRMLNVVGPACKRAIQQYALDASRPWAFDPDKTARICDAESHH